MLHIMSRPSYKELNTRRTKECSFSEVARNNQIQKKKKRKERKKEPTKYRRKEQFQHCTSTFTLLIPKC